MNKYWNKFNINFAYLFNFDINLILTYAIIVFFLYKIWFYIRICIFKHNIKENAIMYVW